MRLSISSLNKEYINVKKEECPLDTPPYTYEI